MFYGLEKMSQRKKAKLYPEGDLIKFRVVLNYARMPETHYNCSYSKAQAQQMVFNKVAKLHGVSISVVRGMFDGNHDNISVEIDLIVPIAMEKTQKFAIREGGRTIGAGRITEIIE